MTDLNGWSNRLYWLSCITLIAATSVIAGGHYLRRYVVDQLDPVLAQVDEQVGLLRQDLEKQQARLIALENRPPVEAAVSPSAVRSSSTSAKLSTPVRATTASDGSASVSVPITSASSPVSDGGSININTATSAQLQQLPGIGPSYAEKIIAGRPYASVEDLLKVKGVGEKTLEKLRPLILAQ